MGARCGPGVLGQLRVLGSKTKRSAHTAQEACSSGRKGLGDEIQRQYEFSFDKIELKSLILAQIERWRHALHMQVERQRGGNPGGERRTGEEYIGTCPRVGDNAAKAALIPHILRGGKWGTCKGLTLTERPMSD